MLREIPNGLVVRNVERPPTDKLCMKGLSVAEGSGLDAQWRVRIKPGKRNAAKLRQHFDKTPLSERILRNWTKMAGFAPSVLMSHEEAIKGEDLIELVDEQWARPAPVRLRRVAVSCAHGRAAA